MADIILKPTDWNIQAAKYGVKPGDRLVLQGDRKEIEFHDLVGTAEKPIIVTALQKITIGAVNQGGRVVQFVNCQYIRLTGDPAGTGAVNIFINGGGHGVDFRELSSDVEADHLDITTGYSGINAKTDPTCDPKTWRGNFTMRNVHIHHNRISTATGEGVYAGQSHYNGEGAIQGGPCASGAKTAPEHEMVGVIVEDNVITTSGADGIQVGACPSGALIRRNKVFKYGTINAWGQNSGIIVNPGTVAEVYDNLVDTGTGFGIQLQGPGGSKVRNNLILNAGMGGVMAAVYKCIGVPAQPDYQVYNNTLVNIRGVGLQFYCPVTFKNNVLQLAGGTAAYKNDGGAAGKLTESGNVQLSGNSEQLDSNYVPVSATVVPAGVGYKDYVKPPPVITRRSATIELVTTDGVDAWFIVLEDGKRIPFKLP